MTNEKRSIDISRARVQRLIDMDSVANYIVSEMLDEIDRLRNENEGLRRNQPVFDDLTRGLSSQLDEIERLRAGSSEHRKWLADRVEWLKHEMDHGGDWKYLQLKREETIYCLEKFDAHIPALDRLGDKL